MFLCLLTKRVIKVCGGRWCMNNRGQMAAGGDMDVAKNTTLQLIMIIIIILILITVVFSMGKGMLGFSG